jgi:Ca2+-binding EF-hand superfamily protein
LSGSNAWASSVNQRTARASGSADRDSFVQQLFAKTDAYGSGSVDATGLQSLLTGIAKKTGATTTGTDAASSLAALDSDGNGSLSSSELAGGLKRQLAPPSDTLAFARSRGGG